MIEQSSNSIATTLLKAVSEAYPGDAIKPGINLSYLGTVGGFYASVVRWPGHNQKSVVAFVTGHTSAGAAVRALAQEFLRYYNPQKTARDELAALLGGAK